MGRSTEEQVRIVGKVLDREDEVNTSDITSNNRMGREPSSARRPTMGRGPTMAGGSVKSFNTNISTRGTKTPSLAGSRVSKNDARSVQGSSNTPFAFSKQSSSKAGGGSISNSNAGNTPYANSKQSSSSADKPTSKQSSSADKLTSK